LPATDYPAKWPGFLFALQGDRPLGLLPAGPIANLRCWQPPRRQRDARAPLPRP